ncbi:hypothetical protein A5893_03740 [Pedobacter psychrophilus]|uniref:Gingipain domain-containing protein n=1 Tax=Pedobacter psychrophilus TaxID=1826909 RepID=A0A179DME4_9SPHI|nr:C25 family cysteine peptidase [Pedobacter psychrophilus]OAQ42236.1 hypothetical protein A5893_03740 [Pedobacter psychrophilus]
MFKRLVIVSFFLAICLNSFAQQYGNEWIDFSQKYAKITINNEGLFKITYDDVIAKNLFLGNLDPNKFQIFNKGIEIPLMITGSQDGKFDQRDEIFFYGNKNDASLDKILYTNLSDLPNDEISLFTNENFYFLTYSPTKTGLRYQISNLPSTGLTPENYVIARDRLNFDSNYYPGEYILDAMSLSEYIEGEGYLGSSISKGQVLNYQLNTSNFITSNYPSSVSIYIAGRSNAASTNSNGNNHHFRLINNSTTLFDSLYRGYKSIRKTIPLIVNTNSTNIAFSSIDDLGAVTDFQAPGYLEIKFSRNLNLAGLSNLSFKLENSKSSTLLNFSNSNLVNPIILEKKGNNGFLSSGNNSYVIKDANSILEYYLVDQNNAMKAQLNGVTFKNINQSSSKNYLIISNNSLKAGAEAYQLYNQSISMPTSIVYTDDLYNEFYYGFHHPVALRNYCKYMIEKGSVKPEYLLLLGKGYENSRENMTGDLVPTIGYPGSDNMLTSGLNGSNLEPGLATGRIPARNNTDINNYLNKLKVYNVLGNDLWRKKILQTTGGKTISEVTSFGNYQENLYQISKFEYFGATRSRIYKNVTDPITENQTEKIINETRDGIALLSYLGHGSATGTEIAFGKAVDQLNQAKPTIYLVNGCSTGQCFTTINALSEDFILTKDVGAVAWIGTSSEGVASYLMSASAKYHENWFNKLYGQSIAKGIKEGLKSFQNANDKLNLAHTRQYIYLGDPYLKFNSPQKPDFNIQNSYLFPTESSQNATAAALNISLKIENLQKSIKDSVSIKIERTLPDNSVLNIPAFKIKPIYNKDTIPIKLNNTGLNVAGNNKIKVTVNFDNSLDESITANNIANLDLFLPGNGVKTIYPINKGIISRSPVVLKAEPDNLFAKNAEYLFEIDSLSTFNSPFKSNSPIITAGVFPQWSPPVLLKDGKVYYWRTRLNLPIDQGGNWTNSSFTYLKNTLDGYSIANKSQLENLTLTKLSYSVTTGNFEFLNNYFTTSITTMGDDAPNPTTKRFRTTQAVDFGTPLFEGITLVAMNPLTPNKFFSYPSPFNSTNGPMLVNGYTGQYFWNINDPIQVDSLIRFINQIPNNYHVIGLNGRNATINQLSSNAKLALQSFGLNKFNLVNYGEPYLFWGIKGTQSGSALEFTADYTSNIPPKSQTFQIIHDLLYPLSSGSFTTEPIGPSQEWRNVDISYAKNNFDDISYDIIGVTPIGVEQTIMKNIKNDKFDISNILAKDYPYLKIKTNVTDETEFSFPHLNHLIIDSKPLSDFSFNTDVFNQFKDKQIQEGDSLKWEIGISNTLDYDTDSISGTYTITNQNQKFITKPFSSLAPLKPGITRNIKIAENTLNFSGSNTIKIQLNSANKDLYSFNNNISYDYAVQKDIKQSFVNVLFDGRNIINGDIVSPKPNIQISNTDDNKFLLLNDTANVDIYIKRPKDDNFKRISYSDKSINFKPSTSEEKNISLIEYKPELLDDGLYTLKVKAKDVSGNMNNNDYLVDFEIINESSLTHFYPYPNPVVNAMKFVFTLTGAKVPDKIKITIYNSSAKVVKTITKSDLGNIKIGNNISDFTWDCTDEFGDRLANGVYFYKVDISDADENFNLRRTFGDKNFKSNTGKIYIIK